jgi:hypothetical protein
MVTLPPKVETDPVTSLTGNCFPDDAPAEYIAVIFNGTNYVFYESGDEVPVSD